MESKPELNTDYSDSNNREEELRKFLEELAKDEDKSYSDDDIESDSDSCDDDKVIIDEDMLLIGNLRRTIYTIAQRINAIKFVSGNRVKKAVELYEHVDQVIFELIKEVTVKGWKENGNSIKSIAGSDTADEKKLQRALKYSNHYKTLHNEEYFNYFGKILDELVVKKVPDGRKRYFYSSNLSEYDVYQLKAMKELDILGYLTDRRITDVKKISNGRLDDDFQEYREYFSGMPEKTSEEFLLKSILIQTTEIKYHIEAIYRLASKMSQYNNCDSKEKMPDYFVDTAILLICNYVKKYAICNENGDCVTNRAMYKENSMIFMQFKAIESFSPNNLKDVCIKYMEELDFSFKLKQEVKQHEDIMEIIKKTTVCQRVKFIKKYYNVVSIFDEEPVWKNKKESNFRIIVDKCVKNLEAPKIK